MWLIETWRTAQPATKVTSLMAGIVTAVCGMIAAIPPAWAVIEPYYYATRAYVREHTTIQLVAESQKLRSDLSVTTAVVRDLQIDATQNRCAAVASQIITLTSELPKAPYDVERARKQFQLSQLQHEYNGLDAKLAEMRGRGCPYSTGR